MMSLILSNRPDALTIRSSTAGVVYRACDVSLNMAAISALAKKLRTRIQKKKLLTETQFGSRAISPQRIFLQDAVNYCFWSKKGEPKWTVEYPKGTILDGWTALVACFDRALKEGIPILDASYLKHLTLPDARYIFRSSTETPIPLLDQRIFCLREAGRVMVQSFHGDIKHMLKQSKFHADTIAYTIIKYFSSFEDSATYEGKQVYFYKRAQIAAYDLSLLPSVSIDHVEHLTVFADYKLPQLFRAFHIIEYTESLASRVDSMNVLKKGSAEEVEIRAATIWVGELLAHTIGVMPAVADNALWSMCEDVNNLLPYHRCLTTSY